MTLEQWRRERCVETGDTGRRVYTDDVVSYSVFETRDGRWFYVEHDEIDEQKPDERGINGVWVRKDLRPCWVDCHSSEPLIIAK